MYSTSLVIIASVITCSGGVVGVGVGVGVGVSVFVGVGVGVSVFVGVMVGVTVGVGVGVGDKNITSETTSKFDIIVFGNTSTLR